MKVFVTAAFAAAWLAIAAHPAPAGDRAQLERGHDLLGANCARCHAVGLRGASPHRKAPPFRRLGRHYPIDSLEESLAEGILTGHPDMPEFSFDAHDVGAIIAYLKAIQRR